MECVSELADIAGWTKELEMLVKGEMVSLLPLVRTVVHLETFVREECRFVLHLHKLGVGAV